MASDIDSRKLKELRRRAKRAGVGNIQAVELVNEIGAAMPKPFETLFEKASRVLVDAPCTGVGALRRNPEARWRLSESDLARFPPLQLQIAERALELSASRIVRNGRTLARVVAHAKRLALGGLAGGGARKLLKNMYGDRPAWSPRLTGPERDRAIINVFTRMRYCSPRGRIAFEEKGAPGTQAPGLYPWYEVPGRAQRDLKIACGHWSTLGLFIGHGVHALDTGAVWGGKLTALRLDSEDLQVVQVPGRDVGGQPG